MFILWAILLFLLGLFVIMFLFAITPYVLPIFAAVALFALSFMLKDIVVYSGRTKGNKQIAITLQTVTLSAAIILVFITMFQMSIPQFVKGSVDLVNTSSGDILTIPYIDIGIPEIPIMTIMIVIVGSLLSIYAMTTYGRVLERRGR